MVGFSEIKIRWADRCYLLRPVPSWWN